MIRLIGYFFGIGTTLALLVAAGVAIYIGHLAKDLPDYEVLAKYEPPVTTRIHASDGALMAEYARERRLYLPIQAVPDRVKAAFLSAEDKNFYNHPGIDVTGLGRAIMVNLQNFGSGKRQVGASTITQQVAKNFLLSSDQTYERKIKEMILAFRIEQAYSKDRILELYLNEIFFGFGAYGVAGAALTYFDKSVNELTVAEAAYLASLPKGPNNYHPFKHADRALERRNWVIDQMVENGYVTREEGDKAKAEPLGVTPRRNGNYLFAGEYFTEEVRRQIIARYGENALYEGGLSVRTTIDPKLQLIARKSIQSGLMKFDTLRGYRGPVTNIDISGDWGVPLGKVKGLEDVPEWSLAVVLDSSATGLSIGLQPARQASGELVKERIEGTVSKEDMGFAMRHVVDGKTVKAKSPADVLKPGDVIFVQKNDGSDGTYSLRQVPEVEGGLIAMDPHTGRVLAMVGGFSYAQSEFNRATQAMRQPGSSFKPIVYSAALDNGYTPASVIMDGPITIQSGNTTWTPKNYDGTVAGPATLRSGIEKSRNLMTVRLANDMGMKLVVEYAERFGVYDHLAPYLPMALGSGETTVMRMVSAYSIMANGGKSIKPSLIDRIQDRYGKTVFKQDERSCEGCNATEWKNQPEPELVDNFEQVLDPMTAYQITSMMEGVVQRGTGATIAELGRHIAGKTGTTNDEKDAWFIGYTPNLVVGLYMGYDQPRGLGKGATGGGLAAPIFKDFMRVALDGTTNVDFQVPEGMKLIAINRKTGMRAAEGEPGTIIEAFKPGTGPADSYWVIGMGADGSNGAGGPLSPQATQAIQSGGGGLY
ncbi:MULTISPECIES: penicillin-binding protein 1A [unclassified Mesorhizobium]|uniref:penicillin-binding protein 1A n=1 Tax=unclassified Mesorhizobium TaxID=325217 RepID=UPI000FD8C333|nr:MULTISPECIES: penicillin-binding protein 1A [unclassified Mesorhizobium]TGQ31888.1 penicillin-binding protein 1A [Mesorhizobium sp. M00.F.Ca.ET.216.01.1.1]TIS58248.1 MAG: PBP1A family penicillin-binding protein [Mesorhizobium sp.]TIS92767.1 MAG: PBP1A family penicillin-binding protein [Mesorhizobium sp.]TJW47526.1 MAG: PBP1A family penicillin-binding protein [Mesorhizobium sp.]